ncbi:MAG: MAPEG family protein [Mesorhizobium sp.]
MNPTAIFWPMIAHVGLVCVIYVLLAVRRRHAVLSGAVKPNHFQSRANEPQESASVAANLMNQFELPVFFHVVCLALFATNGVSYVAVMLAWLFVVLRYAHAFVHVTSNDLRYRSPAFAAGFVVLVALWAWFALHLTGAV